jgi:hypothetical protein
MPRTAKKFCDPDLGIFLYYLILFKSSSYEKNLKKTKENNLIIDKEGNSNLGVVCSMKNDKGIRLLGDHQEVAHRPELGEHGKQVRLKQEQSYSKD